MKKHIRFDWAMKRLLRNKANFDILEGFLSELLKQDIKISEILESESNQEHETDKFNRVDILVKNQDGEFMLIEVQNEREYDYFHRMNYGQAKLLIEQLDAGDEYINIKKIFSINIVYFDLGHGDDYIYVGQTEFKGLHHKDILQLNPSQKKLYPQKDVADIFTTYYVLKVNKFDDFAQDSLDEWIYFLKNNEIKDEFSAKGLDKAKEKLRIDNLNKAEKEIYERFVKIKRIQENELKSARFDGRLEAEDEYLPKIEEALKREDEALKREEEARKREAAALEKEKDVKRKMAKMMLLYNEPVEKIIEQTGLCKEEVAQLKQEINNNQ